MKNDHQRASTGKSHPSYNDQQYRSEGAPQVIITDIVVPEEKITFGVDGMYRCSVSYVIEVRHSSASNARTVADEVASKFRGAGKRVLEEGKLKNIKLSDEDKLSIPWAQGKKQHIHNLAYSAIYIGAS